MAIVSIQRIINTQDRTVLDMEYRNIISNLKLGNIESDPEIIELYQELMNVISGKTLTREAAERLQKDYDAWEHQILMNSLYGVRAYSVDPFTIGATFAVSCMSSYFAYQDITEGPRKNLDESLYKIDVQERESYNALQTKLLNSSWRLMRQYKMPDEYRIVQDSVNDLYKAVNDPNSRKSLNMMRALEDEFRIYPPYWVYRARAAQRAGNESEAAKCYEEFGRVWRPVLRNDPWKLEAEKFAAQEAMKAGNNSEALKHIALARENTARNDWADNLFAGVSYFVLGDKENGINCVELNLNFETETEISGAVLEQMNAGKLNLATLPEDLRKVIGVSALRIDTLKTLALEGDLESQLRLGKLYADGEVLSKDYAESVKWYTMAANQDDETAILALAGLYKKGGYNLNKDYLKARDWFMKLADKGYEVAILGIARLYREGGPNLPTDHEQAVTWYEKAAYDGSKTAQNELASLYFYDEKYYSSYVWCCVAEIKDLDSAGGRAIGVAVGGTALTVVFGAPFLPIIGAGYVISDLLADRSIKEQIEGKGIFNLAKLSDSQIESAKYEAEKIARQIRERIKQREQ